MKKLLVSAMLGLALSVAMAADSVLPKLACAKENTAQECWTSIQVTVAAIESGVGDREDRIGFLDALLALDPEMATNVLALMETGK